MLVKVYKEVKDYWENRKKLFLTVVCPKCGAGIGELCKTKTGKIAPHVSTHSARVNMVDK